MLAAAVESGGLAITTGIDQSVLGQGFRQIEEDENKRAIGSPLALALLFGAGEPLFRRKTKQEELIRQYSDRISFGCSRDVMRLAKDFDRFNNRDWWY